MRPNFLIVGAPRSGTSALYLYLKQHPDVYLSVLKEPHFFGSDLTVQPHAIRDPELYRNLFAGADDALCIGEGSVWYLRSELAAREIHADNPAMRILVLLRDPVEMISSLHALYLRTGNEDLEDLEAALKAEPERAAGKNLPARHYFPEGLQYRCNVAYDEQVRRYLEVFGRQQIHFIFFDEFRHHPREVLAGVMRFLGLTADFSPELDLERAEEKVRDLVLPQLKRAHPTVRAKLRAWYRHHSGPREQPSRALRQRLIGELEPGIRRLAARLGRNLDAWLEA